MVEQRVKYDTKDTFVKHTIILDRAYVNMWNEYHKSYEKKLKALESITPYLRELGIKRDDFVISIPDGTINVTLSMMDQKGFTDFGYGWVKDEERMEYFIERGAEYLIINDPGILNKSYLKPFMDRPIGTYHNVTIYKLPSYRDIIE